MTAVDLFAVLRAQGLVPHQLRVERFAAPGAGYGDTYADPETVEGFYKDGIHLVADQTGKQIASSGVFGFPLSYAYVPLQSRVTLPAKFGSRVTEVVAVEVGDGGGLPTPDYQQIHFL